jgi:hypothetical protein
LSAGFFVAEPIQLGGPLTVVRGEFASRTFTFPVVSGKAMVVDGPVAITRTSHGASRTEVVGSFDPSIPGQFPFDICVDGPREVEGGGNISWGSGVCVVEEPEQAAIVGGPEMSRRRGPPATER